MGVCRRLCRRSGDSEVQQLFDFYACYRAYVRGKVRSLRLAQLADARADQTRIIAESRAYFDLAWAHAGGLGAPPLLICMGLPASGKTTLARNIAGRLGLVHVSSDRVRKAMAGVQPTQRGTDSFRQGMYDSSMTERTYAALRRNASRWLRRSRGVVLDATYGDPAERARVQQLAERLGVRLRIVLCHADDETLLARLKRRATEPGVVSDARIELWPELRAAFDEPRELADVLKSRRDPLGRGNDRAGAGTPQAEATQPTSWDACAERTRSKRSRFMTLFHAATKSRTNFSFRRRWRRPPPARGAARCAPKTRSTAVAVHLTSPVARSRPSYTFVVRGGRLPLRAHVEQVHEEVVGQRLRPVGEDAVLRLAEVGVQRAHAADERRHLGRGQLQHVGALQQPRSPATARLPPVR